MRHYTNLLVGLVGLSASSVAAAIPMPQIPDSAIRDNRGANVPVLITVDVSNEFPVEHVIGELRDELNLPVSYTDVQIAHSGDYYEVLDRSTGPLFANLPNPLYSVPATNVVFSFLYEPDAPRKSAQRALTALVVAFNAQNHFAQYEVLVEEGRFEVNPTQVHDTNGQYVPFESSMDRQVTLPRRKLLFSEAIFLLVEEMNNVTPYTIETLPNWADGRSGMRVRVGGTQTARAHLLSIFTQHEENERTGRTKLWRETCFVNNPTAGCKLILNEVTLRPWGQTPRSDLMCGTSAADFNARILGQVEELAGTPEYTCRSGTEATDAFVWEDLWQYDQDYGWDGTSFADINVKFNVEGQLQVLSPCAISFSGDDGLLAIQNVDRMCVNGRSGVQIGTDDTVPQGDPLVPESIIVPAMIVESAEGSVELGANLVVRAKYLRLEATEDVTVGQATTLTGRNVDLVADRHLGLGESVQVHGEEGLSLLSSGDVILAPNMVLTSARDDISIVGSTVNLDNASLNAGLTVLVSGAQCDLSNASLVGGGEVPSSITCDCTDPGGCAPVDTALPPVTPTGDTAGATDTAPADTAVTPAP